MLVIKFEFNEVLNFKGVQYIKNRFAQLATYSTGGKFLLAFSFFIFFFGTFVNLVLVLIFFRMWWTHTLASRS